MWTGRVLSLNSKIPQRGFTLVEVAVAMALVGLLSLVVIYISQSVARNSQTSNIGPTRDQILANIRQMGADVRALRQTLQQTTGAVNAGNQQFRDCVCGGGTCNSMQTVGFNLYDLLGLHGQNNTYYDSNGSPCIPTSKNCFIQVTTSFFAECQPVLVGNPNPIPPLTCATPAEFVGVIYTIRQNPLITQQSFIKPISASVYTQVTDIVPLGTACP